MPPAGLSVPFLLTTLANFFFFLNFASFFLLPLHVRALGGTEVTVGAVMGTAGVASLLALPFIGFAIDRFGRRRFLLLGTAVMAASALGFLFVERIGPPLYALRVLQGVSFAAAFTSATTLAAELAPAASRARALGLFGLSTLLTHALAPTVGEELVRRGGFSTLFLTAAAFTVIAFLIAASLPGRRRAQPTDAIPPPWRIGRMQWVLAATMTFAGMGFGTVITFIPTFVRGEELGRVGFFFMSYTAMAILTRLVGAGLSDSVGRRAVILPTLLGLATAIFLLAFVRSVGTLVLVGGLFGLAQGLSYPTLHAFLVDLTVQAHMGRAQAVFNGAFNFGVTSGSFAFGVVAEHFGHRPMFACAAAMPLLAWLVLYTQGAPGSASEVIDPA